MRYPVVRNRLLKGYLLLKDALFCVYARIFPLKNVSSDEAPLSNVLRLN